MYEGQMITSGLNNSGDVVLAPEKKSYKKWIIIGAVSLVIILALVAVFMIPKGGIKMNGGAKEAFNRYANHLLYGEDSDSEIGQYSEEERYAFNNLGDMNYDERNAFFARAENLLNDFEEKLGTDVDTNFKDVFSKYKDDFVLTKMFYLSSNLESSDFISSSHKNVKEYGEYLAEYDELYERYLAAMRSSGCAEAEDIYDECDTYLNEGLLEEIEDVGAEMIALRSSAITNTLQGCFELSNMIYGKTAQPQKEESEDEIVEEDDLDSEEEVDEEENET